MPRGSASFEASRHVKIEALPDAKAMKRTTLAYANSKRDYHIFEKFYLYLVDYFASSFQLQFQKRYKKPTYAIDSTTITLCMKLFRS